MKIFSWRTRAGGLRRPRLDVVGTRPDTAHGHLLPDPTASVFLTPEAFTDPGADPALLDVFSLGAVAYHVLSGQPPAGSAVHLPLTEPGPLARYDAMGVLERLLDDAGHTGHAVRTAWVLVSTEGPTELPVVDGTQVPVITDTQRPRLPYRRIDATPLPARP